MTTPPAVEPFSFAHAVKDTFGRALGTLVMVVSLDMIAGGAPYTVAKVWAALLVGALAAVLSIGTSLASLPFPALRPGVIGPYLDLVLRVVKTFLQAFFGSIVAQNALDITGVHWPAALTVGLAAAGAAFFKGLVGILDPTTSGAGLTIKGLMTINPFTTGLRQHPDPKSF